MAFLTKKKKKMVKVGHITTLEENARTLVNLREKNGGPVG
jgi:hypothetical protein